MRRSTILNVFLLFSVMLLVPQIPGVLAQEVPCLISGKDRLPVAMSEGGSCDTDVSTYFTATFNPGNNLLTLHGNEITPHCSGAGLRYYLTKNPEDTLIQLKAFEGDCNSTLTRRPVTGGYNNLLMSAGWNFTAATANLMGNSIEGSVNTVPAVQFGSPLEGCTDTNGQNYVVMSNPIPNVRGNPIAGPSFFFSETCSTEPLSQPINKIYIPVNQDWSLTFSCGQATFGPVLRDNNHAVPAFSTYGLLLFCLSIFGFGIWAMRKTRFADTLAGR